jgi:hypothetical protein
MSRCRCRPCPHATPSCFASLCIPHLSAVGVALTLMQLPASATRGLCCEAPHVMHLLRSSPSPLYPCNWQSMPSVLICPPIPASLIRPFGMYVNKHRLAHLLTCIEQFVIFLALSPCGMQEMGRRAATHGESSRSHASQAETSFPGEQQTAQDVSQAGFQGMRFPRGIKGKRERSIRFASSTVAFLSVRSLSCPVM